MKITLLDYPTDSDWLRCKENALVTMGLRVVHYPDEDWKHAMLVARHSPIRTLNIRFLIEGMPYWLSTEFARHVHAQPYIKSQRNDRRTKKDTTDDRGGRRQDYPVDMIWEFNAESLMICANKRLCKLATTEARNTMREMCNLLEEKCPEFVGVLVPMCVYHNYACHEVNGCGFCMYDDMRESECHV